MNLTGLITVVFLITLVVIIVLAYNSPDDRFSP